MTEFLTTEPNSRAIAHFLFAHGAGAPMDHPFMEAIADGIASRGILVSRFEFPYMAMRRVDGKRRGPGGANALLQTWRDVIEDAAGDFPLFIGGKSMGGRLASMVAEGPEIKNRVSGVICFGYPFHPPGKPDKLRTEHLKTMSVPTLIVQGERDPFGRPEEVSTYDLPETVIDVIWVPDGDHSLKPRKKSGHTHERNLATAVGAAATFISSITGQ